MTDKGENLIFVKLGGSLITEKNAPYTINYQAITRIVKELKEAIDNDHHLQLLIGHGGGSFPHPVAKSFKTAEGFIQDTSIRGFTLCQNAASTLNRILVDFMVDYAIDAVSIQPSACCIASDGRITDFFTEPIEIAIENGLIPVVFGDCVFDTVRGCTIVSTEQIFSYLSRYIQPSRVLIVGLVGGVYTADPQKDENAQFIPTIEVEKFTGIESYLGESYSVDVTGGMATKVKELIELARRGIECEILNGASGNIKKALTGQRGLGTIIQPVNTAKR
ncbi:MAG: isopentenyl phosphate kinase [Euryarchaeota archaeon]|nr:isopentenyl phosphate kinase [Euryarchaeota archaeon]